MEKTEPSDSPPSMSAVTENPTTASGASATREPRIPAQIGAYRPIRILGEGGMGVVYEAEQIKPRRVVALKVIRPAVINAQLLKRFETEAEVLGRLQHSGIAQIYEAGTADSGYGPQPFFAMELVRGPRIDRFVTDRRLTVRQRVELLVKVCEAVQYAHQRGVIHRDLKPGNILVDENGQPKVLDFGVARVTDAELQATIQPTHTGQVLGTLQYMAPEQARGDVRDVDTAADVYALGVISYEVLGGRPPYLLANRSLIDAVRVICDEEPSRLSSISRTFAGDLQTIIHKALEKDKKRRYASAGELAADFRRFLSNEPIAARPPSSIYQIRKFAARNRAFATGVVALIVLLLAGLLGTLVALNRIRAEQHETLAQKNEAERQKREAQDKSAEAAAINQFLWSMLKAVDPGQAKGTEPTVRQVLDIAGKRVGEEFKDRPNVEAGLRHTIGDTYVVMGRAQEAETHLRRALELQEQKGPDYPGAITAKHMLSFTLTNLGKFDEAEPLARDALDRARRVLGPDDEHTIQMENDLAILLTQTGRFAEAEPLQRDVIERQVQRLGPDHPTVLYAQSSLAFVLTRQGRDADSAALLEDALPRIRHARGDDHPDTLMATQTLAVNLMRLNRVDESLPLVRDVRERRVRVLGPDHPDTLETTSQLALLMARTGEFDEGLALQRDVLERRRKSFGDDHPATLASLLRVAQTLAMNETKLQDAIIAHREVLEKQRKLMGPGHPGTMRTALGLADLLLKDKKPAEVEALLVPLVEFAERDPAMKSAVTDRLDAARSAQPATRPN